MRRRLPPWRMSWRSSRSRPCRSPTSARCGPTRKASPRPVRSTGPCILRPTTPPPAPAVALQLARLLAPLPAGRADLAALADAIFRPDVPLRLTRDALAALNRHAVLIRALGLSVDSYRMLLALLGLLQFGVVATGLLPTRL